MPEPRIYNVNILGEKKLLSPKELKARVPLSAAAESFVLESRETLQKILDRSDPRLFVVVGPCSIHDVESAREYAERLKSLADELRDQVYLVMRVYFQKPRTTVGWKGFINDPYLNDSFCIEEGLVLARTLLLDLAEMGLPVGTEALDPITPQYLQELISWTAIGARTTESQTHREMSSGLSTPVGFKNGTDGDIGVAINALKSVSHGHHFLGIDQNGFCSVLETKGNRYGHMVLRGGLVPNYDPESVEKCKQELVKARLPENIVVDCSHGNSLKDASLQPGVFETCLDQVLLGDSAIVGLMLESNIHAGSQDVNLAAGNLKYGVSITDACIDWQTTEKLLREACEKLRSR